MRGLFLVMIYGSVSLSRGDISRAAHILYILRTFIFLGGITCSNYNYTGTQRLGFLILSLCRKLLPHWQASETGQWAGTVTEPKYLNFSGTHMLEGKNWIPDIDLSVLCTYHSPMNPCCYTHRHTHTNKRKNVFYENTGFFFVI